MTEEQLPLIHVERGDRIDMGSTEAGAWALQREIDPDLPVILRIRWAGEPESKSRARVVTPRKGGRTYAYTPAKTRLAEDRIIVLARQAGLRGPPDGKHSFGILAKFFCAGWQRRDVDNMLKLVADALTGIVWVDDSQVSEVSAVVRRGVGTKDARSHLLIYQTDQPLHPTAQCRQCGTSFKTYPSLSKKQYCSNDCRLAEQRAARLRTCEQCGKKFDPGKPSPARFCSRECQSQHGRVTLPCTTCGTMFTRQKCFVRGVNHCSETCARIYRATHGTNRPKGVCQTCGGPVSKAHYLRCQSCSRGGRMNGAPLPLPEGVT